MRPSKAEVLEWERRWATPAAIAALAAVMLVIAAIVVATQAVGNGNGDAALLRDVDQHRTAQMISSILQAIGVGLLAAPLYYLFRAARARSETMRGQLVGVVVAAPLFLFVLAILSGVSTLHAATDFVAQGVVGTGDHAEKLASDAIGNAPLRPLAAGFGLAGQLGFAIAMFYTSLHAMRTGLLTRFWGSLGMALGVVSFIFFQFTLLWFLYLAFLLLGRVPGGRPPAWAAGEAIPWPSPGEKAAADLSPTPSDPEEPADPALPSEGRRKRKQRD
jgi:hypothetical protein